MDIMLFVAWFIPVAPSFRGRTLLFFSQSGKGSYIDVMFLCYIILVMKQVVHIEGTTTSITAEPVEGIFAGIASTTANLLVCHILWHLHNSKLPQKERQTQRKCNLWQLHVRRGVANSRGWKAWLQGVSFVCIFLVAAACLVVIVFRAEVTWFRLTGVVAEASDPADRYDIIRTYNIYNFPSDLPNNTDNIAGAYVIAIFYSVLVLAVPLLVLVAWLVLWLVPLRKQNQRNLYTTILRCWSFSGLEVFWVASLAAVLEINKVCVWILNHTIEGWCNDHSNLMQICELILPLSKEGKILHISAKFLTGGWWLLSQCILYYALYNATLFFGGMLLGHTSKYGWKEPPSRAPSAVNFMKATDSRLFQASRNSELPSNPMQSPNVTEAGVAETKI